MASDHVIALSHLVGAGLGLALVASAGRSLARRPRTRVRTEDSLPHRPHRRTLARLLGHLLRGTARLTVHVALAVVAPIGLLCANQRYPLVAPVLAPFEAHLAALGHRPAHARCFPLLAWHLWLVRCAGCRQCSVFREVPAPGGSGVDLKALGTSGWRTRRCSADYLTACSARPAQPVGSTQTARATRRPVRAARTIPTASPVAAVPPARHRRRVTNKTA